MIAYWQVPKSEQSLFSLIGLVNFYHKYAPYMEKRMKSLHRLVKAYYRKIIPEIAWTPELIKLFSDLKDCITFSPVLVRINSSTPTVLKRD